MWQIIRQPNSKYAIWSSIVDNLIYFNCSSDEVVDIICERDKDKAKKSTEAIIEKLKSGEKPYHQSTMNWDKVIDRIRWVRGEREANEADEWGKGSERIFFVAPDYYDPQYKKYREDRKEAIQEIEEEKKKKNS